MENRSCKEENDDDNKDDDDNDDVDDEGKPEERSGEQVQCYWPLWLKIGIMVVAAAMIAVVNDCTDDNGIIICNITNNMGSRTKW